MNIISNECFMLTTTLLLIKLLTKCAFVLQSLTKVRLISSITFIILAVSSELWLPMVGFSWINIC